MNFSETLKALPETTGALLTLFDAAGTQIAEIANAPGTAGSFRVYGYLAGKYGDITPAAAEEGLQIFAEHTEDARRNPGKHPNIDRLLSVQQQEWTLTPKIT